VIVLIVNFLAWGLIPSLIEITYFPVASAARLAVAKTAVVFEILPSSPYLKGSNLLVVNFHFAFDPFYRKFVAES
jgi:hypothetical protein